MKGFSPLRDLPALGWMIAVLVVSLIHTGIPAPRWLLFHLMLLGAVTHSILVWSQHFADTLLHTVASEGQQRLRTVRLVLLNVGVIVVIAGVLGDTWHVTMAGAIVVGLAIVWHAIGLALQLRTSHSLTTSARFAITIRFYVAAAALLPVGAYLGVLMARGLGDGAHDRAMIAHVGVNVLGWIGLTISGTLVTLWPTILRTRVAENAVSTARRSLPVLLAGIALVLLAAAVGVRQVAGVGFLVYAAGLVMIIRPHITEARQKPPAHFPGWSVMAGMTWFVISVTALGIGTILSPDWSGAHDWLQRITPAFAAGFATQVLLGALSYLIPVSIGRGPAGSRAANTEFDRFAALRISVTNIGLALWLLPGPAPVRVALSGIVLVALGTFVPLLFSALGAARKAAAEAAANLNSPGPRPHGPAPVSAVVSAQRHLGHAVTGVAAVVLAVAVGVAVDPQALGRSDAGSAAAGVTATGQTTTVEVTAKDMRFHPASVDVPVGNRLVIKLTNTDKGDVHDLVLDSGADSGRLAPGESTTLDVGVVGRTLDGWCSVLGHRQMGMVFKVNVIGGAASNDTGSDDGTGHDMPGMTHPGSSTTTEPGGSGTSDETPFTPYDATLPPVPNSRTHRMTFTVTEGPHPVAEGVTQTLWTYNGSAPGPTLHGRLGDRFVITLVNDGTMGHSLDFHAGERNPEDVMRTIPPGESLVYEFTATRSGIWMYHCSSMPMTAHIANGLFGAVIIDPPDLKPVDHSYVLVQSEYYLGADGGPVDIDKLNAEKPDLVVFNGYANQYDQHPLKAKVGERIRIWVLDAGPNRASSFHVVGGQFDTVWSEGDYRLRPGNASKGGAQVLPLLAAQGGFVEMTFPEPGRYPFVNHIMVDAERGAHGIIEVTR